MIQFNDLTLWNIISSLGIGILMSCLYLFLLWKTLLKLPHTNHKGLLLFVSLAIRLTLLIFIAVHFSFGHYGRFLFIVIGFMIARGFIIRHVKKSIQQHYDNQNHLSVQTHKKHKPSHIKQHNQKHKK